MWQILIAAAVAGSGLLARTLFNTKDLPERTVQCQQQQNDELPKIDEESKEFVDSPKPLVSIPFSSAPDPPHIPNAHNIPRDDGIFRFSSSGARNETEFRSVSKTGRKKLGSGSRGNIGNVDGFRRGVEVQKRFSVCVKKRRTAKNASVKCGSCSTKENALFGWGLGVGIMYMVSAGKAEISKLNTVMDDTAKVVQELKSELYKRKSMRNLRVSNSITEPSTNATNIRDKHRQPVNTKSSPANREPNEITNPSFHVTDAGEYASSVLTEEPEAVVLEMDQLEAELESELQKLPLCATEDSVREGIKSDFGETQLSSEEYHEPQGQSSDSHKFNGVLPSELNQKLCHVLVEQKESQIVELESELHLAHSKLHEKETELQVLKNCVKRLTEFSLSAGSDDETEEHAEQDGTSKWDHNYEMESESKKPMVGMKRSLDSESCGYHVQ